MAGDIANKKFLEETVKPVICEVVPEITKTQARLPYPLDLLRCDYCAKDQEDMEENIKPIRAKKKKK